ncbi:hypothetical protein [Methylobacterium gnaphalii]|uniref:Uncharacterized protein n=1 Tax=Methylobacterium gnaphalii TaxID=1010610 RepID=A0A512JR66_9HYPH|nr:hypothetical protein [Methylobacterium gnaphalii]GEP12454.1 hypothetical protein MGN01_42990 [Methylobacterium gnaphalii]GJD70873.1 hypothetical protein MMMDOFMJ_3826 [Methylobacterium gnaphalii]GLS51546.1 hypothetical protein GCM10007885_44040 [Methylobacterium gnaphalii]
MDLIRKAIAGIVPVKELSCLHVEGLPPSVRIIKARTSTLLLVVTPVEHTGVVLNAFSGDESLVYGLANHGLISEIGLIQRGVRFGATNRHLSHRMRRHLANPPVKAARTLFVVAGRTADVLTAELAFALESELARLTPLAGAYRIIGSYSFPTLSAPTQLVLDHWVEELRLMLIDAGVPVLEQAAPDSEPGKPAQPEEASDHGLRSGFSLSVPSDLTARPDVQRWQLSAGEVQATAICCPGWTVLQPGATARAVAVRSNQPCLTRKRQVLHAQGILQRRDRHGRVLELLRPLRVPSLVNAARLLFGNNSDGREWRRVS